MSTETIFCRNCGTELTVSRQTECPTCHEVVFTKAELLAQIRGKIDRVNTLNGEIAVIRSELYYRTHRSGGLYVWEQPKPALFPVVKTRTRTESKMGEQELAEFV